MFFAVVSEARAEAPQVKAYPIHLSVPASGGDKYRYISTNFEKTHSKVTGVDREPVVKESEFTIELEGIVMALAVDSNGSETMLSCTIQRFQRIEEKVRTDLLPPGSVVFAKAFTDSKTSGLKSGTRFALKNGKLTQAQITAISHVFAARIPDAPTDQQIFGAAEPKRIGDSWSINSEKGAIYFATMGLAVDSRDLKGQSSLTGIENLSGQDHLRVYTEFSSEKFTVPVPAGTKTEKTVIISKITTLIPLDGTLHSYTQTVDTDANIVLHGTNPQSGDFTVDNSTKTRRVVEITPLQK